MPQKLRIDADLDFTLTADFDSNELLYGRSNDLTVFLDLARDLRDTKPAIKRIDFSILGNGIIRIDVSGPQVNWSADYTEGGAGDFELDTNDIKEWNILELPFVEAVVDKLLVLHVRHLLTDLKYLIT